MRGISTMIVPVSLALAAAALSACEGSKQAADDAGVGPGASQVVGKIGADEITTGEIDEWIKDQLFAQATRGKNPMKVYEVRNRALEQMANERAADEAAAKSGKDREALMKEEVEKRASVTDEEVQKYYDEHKDRFRNLPFEKVAPAVKRQLLAQRQVAAMQEYTKGLRDQIGFENRLEPPRFAIPAGGPSRGPEAADVTIVEFSDYECPFCKAAEPVVKQVLERYPTQVRVVFKHYPLETHPKARPAAEAALCAEEQGKFWEFHQKLFEKSPQIAAEQLGPIAAEVGLDQAKFDECMKARRFQARVEADLEAGKKASVAGTPAFFVNGVPVSGGRSVDEFAKAINAELTRLGKPVPEPPPATAATPAAPPIVRGPGTLVTPQVPGMPAPAAPAAAPGAPLPAPAPNTQQAASPPAAAPTSPPAPASPPAANPAPKP
jgi:protein-disulfide isomerase